MSHRADSRASVDPAVESNGIRRFRLAPTLALPNLTPQGPWAAQEYAGLEYPPTDFFNASNNYAPIVSSFAGYGAGALNNLVLQRT
jgi:hypothetical protein